MQQSAPHAPCRVVSILLFAAAALNQAHSPAHAFETSTHRRMTDKAVDSAKPLVDSHAGVTRLTDLLESRYGLANGLSTTFTALGATRSARDWTGQGSEDEDNTVDGAVVVTRYVNHFHDPTCTWTEAGLSPGPGESALLWAQDPNQSSLGLPADHRSWRDFRKWLWKALTDSAVSDRNTDWAQTFKTLGHQLHLVQDMGSPAHTRNDPHPAWNVDSLHEWAALHPKKVSGITESEVDSNFSESLVGGVAADGVKVPIANLFDTTDTAPNVFSYGTTIGLGEYSSEHYFSDDAATIAAGDVVESCHVYAHPSENDVGICGTELTDPDTGRPARYVCDNQQGVVLGRVSPLMQGSLGRQRVAVDGRSLDSVGPILLMRAVGYSAGLVDYAFRGNIDVCVGVNTGESIIKNAGNEPMKGVFGLYYDDTQGGRHLLANWDTTDPVYLPAEAEGVLGAGKEMHVTFFPPDGSLPAPAQPGTYEVVFKGDLGNEKTTGGDDPGAVFARTVYPSMVCRESIWQWTSPTTLSEYLVGANSVPETVPVYSFEVPVPAGAHGAGVAVEPTNGNLWFTAVTFPSGAGDGTIFQVDPTTGAITQEIPVTGTAPPSASGIGHNLFSGIAVDRFDRAHLWLADQYGEHGSNYVYEVSVADGQVIRTCTVSDFWAGIANVQNLTIGVGAYGVYVAPRFGGIVPPSDVLTYSRVCGASGAFRLAPPLPKQPWETWVFAVASNAYEELVVAALPPSGDATSSLFYNVGDPTTFYQSILGASPIFSSPNFAGNFALGSKMP